MKRAVPTRWNSLAEAIGRALYLRLAIDELHRLGKYDKPANKGGLRHLRLSGVEWDILTQLNRVLQVRCYVVILTRRHVHLADCDLTRRVA